MNPKIKEYLEKLGNILLTAIISAVIAWLQAILVDQKGIEVATAEPETAGAIGAIARGIVESIKQRV
jgi:hypothetical protein